MPCMHGIRIHNPGHCLLISVHIGGRNIFFGPNEIEQFRRIPSSHSLQLADRHLLRVTNNSALRTSKWNVHHSTLPCHPCSQCTNLIQAHVWCVTNPTLGRSSGKVMLNAISLKHLNTTRVHPS